MYINNSGKYTRQTQLFGSVKFLCENIMQNILPFNVIEFMKIIQALGVKNSFIRSKHLMAKVNTRLRLC